MISAIVLAPGKPVGEDLGHAREIVVRSMVWLVSAVVSGVVRDVILAVPSGLGLSDVADQAGCAIVEAETETDRLAQAVAASRNPRVFVLKTGFQPDGGLIEEIDTFARRAPLDAAALLLAAPESALQRLAPDRAPIVGCLVSRNALTGTADFARLARSFRRGTRLRARATRIA